MMNKSMNTLRKWCRNIHRDLSFLFSGVLIVYAVSGVALNHKDSFNSNFSIEKKEYKIRYPLPVRDKINESHVHNLLKEIDEENHYTKHYFPQAGTLKVFLKGGSNLVVELSSGNAEYERVSRRPFLSAVSRLHYNPGKWWTVFSDIFAVSLLIIVLTGIFMIKGRKGIRGIGGIELLVGIAVPLIFLFFW